MLQKRFLEENAKAVYTIAVFYATETMKRALIAMTKLFRWDGKEKQMARDKEFDFRMQGLKFALGIAEKEGIEGLRKEVSRRGITKLPFTVSQAEANRLWHELTENMYNNIATAFLYTLHDQFDFTEEQIEKLMDAYNENVANTLDMDYLGEHYISMVDYAVELKEKCNINIDVNRIAACTDHYDETGKTNYHRVEVNRLIQILEEEGYMAAATFLKHKVF